MDNILQQITDVLCKYHPPHHHCMYPIRQLGIRGTRVHYRERKKILTYEDKIKLRDLYERLINVEINEDDCRGIYYRTCVYDKLLMVINNSI